MSKYHQSVLIVKDLRKKKEKHEILTNIDNLMKTLKKTDYSSLLNIKSKQKEKNYGFFHQNFMMPMSERTKLNAVRIIKNQKVNKTFNFFNLSESH